MYIYSIYLRHSNVNDNVIEAKIMKKIEYGVMRDDLNFLEILV